MLYTVDWFTVWSVCLSACNDKNLFAYWQAVITQARALLALGDLADIDTDAA